VSVVVTGDAYLKALVSLEPAACPLRDLNVRAEVVRRHADDAVTACEVLYCGTNTGNDAAEVE